MERFTLATVLTLVLAASAPLSAQDCEPEEVALWPTAAEHVVVAGGLGLLTTEGQGVEVLDLSDPSQPTLLAEIVVSGWNPVASALLGDLALVLGTSADPTLWVFDLSDPASPQLVGVNDQLPHTQNRIVAAGVLAVIGGGYGIQVVDVSDPANPIVTASVDSVWCDGPNLTIHDTTAYAHTIPGWQLVALDLSDPSNPRIVGPFTDVPRPDSLAASGNRLFVASGLWVLPNVVTILDISDPVAPVVVGEFRPSNAPSREICASGSFVALLQLGLIGFDLIPRVSLWNVTSSSHPHELGIRTLPEAPVRWSYWGTSVACEGTLVYAIEEQGLQVLDFAQCLLQHQQWRVPALGPVGIFVMATLLALIGARLVRGRMPWMP